MFGNKKKEISCAEQVEILLGEEAQYDKLREGSTGDICPLLSHYGDYAVCNHLVSGSYVGNSYDYIYQMDVYPSSADKTNLAFHGSVLRIHNIQTSRKIYCCTEKTDSLSGLKGNGWVEQEKIAKLRVWTEDGRLNEEEKNVIELYGEWMKRKNSALCYFHSKEFAFYFDGNNMTVLFLDTKKMSLERKLDAINVFLLTLEEKKILVDKGGKLTKENCDFFCQELVQKFFGETVQYKKITDGRTSALFPILSFYGDIMDCRRVITAECAGYEFEYMDYITISASGWDKKIHHWAFSGNSLVIHGIKTFEKLCVSTSTIWENIKPFGFSKRQKINEIYIWTEERELRQQEIGLVKKYCQWVKDSHLWFHQALKFMMYFDCNNLIIIFWEPESSSWSWRLEDIKKAFHVLRMDERKEPEEKADE